MNVAPFDDQLDSVTAASSVDNFDIDGPSSSTSPGSIQGSEVDASARAVSAGVSSQGSSLMSKISAIATNEVDSGRK